MQIYGNKAVIRPGIKDVKHFDDRADLQRSLLAIA